MFEIRFSNKSEKFLNKCDEKLRDRLKRLFIKLQETPLPVREYDLKKISGEEDIYRIRLSSYRIVYYIDWENRIIRVLFIKRRDENIYKKL